MMKISAIVVTKNEAQNIARCLKSLSTVADEIVVVDAYSQDGTTQICESFPNVQIVSCPWIGLDGMKNLGKKVALYEHTMSIGADEVLSPELQQNLWNIKRSFQNNVLSQVNQSDRPFGQFESAFNNMVSRQPTYENFSTNRRSTVSRKPQLEEVW